jgi:LmbE family N-acetylglucosaminyl deacetylase
MDVVDVAVTQGSNKSRQPGRWAELTGACRFLGFGLLPTAPGGLEKITLQGRDADRANWANAVQTIADLLRRERPAVLFFPHDLDWNGTHIGTHFLVVDAMRSLGPSLDVLTVETEFWGAMDDPNLMVESGADDVADLVAAISFHVGEVQRNPYHVTLPAWMQDNVRRGGELVGGQGGAAPDYAFATLYRLRRWAKGDWQAVLEKGRSIGRNEPLDLFDRKP